MAKADWRMRSGSVKEPRLIENIMDDDDDDEMIWYLLIYIIAVVEYQSDMLADEDVVINVDVCLNSLIVCFEMKPTAMISPLSHERNNNYFRCSLFNIIY